MQSLLPPNHITGPGQSSYSAMLDALPDMVFYLDKDFNYGYANERFRQWLGNDEESFLHQIRHFAEEAFKGRAVHFENHISHGDTGSETAIEASFHPDWNEHRQVNGFLALVRDVSNRKAVETELSEKNDRLKASEFQLRQLLQAIPVAVYSCDMEGAITMFNEAAVELWGRRPDIGSPCEDSPMATCLSEKRAVIGEEIIIEKANGVRRNILPFPKPIFNEDGQMTGAINTLIDVTIVRKAEKSVREIEAKYREMSASLEKQVRERTKQFEEQAEELRKSEEKYHKMIDEVEDYAILLLDQNGYIQNWNKGAQKIKGYSEKEIIGKHFRIFYGEKEQQSRLPEQLIGMAAEKGKAFHEGWRVKKSGEKFWGSVLITSIHNDSGYIVGYTKVTRDLTERKFAEDEKTRYSQQLEFQNRELEQFAYAASHDMKEPLRKIIFYNSFILDRIGDTLPEKERDYFMRSVKAAKRMQMLIDDLLSYSKTTVQEEKMESVDLNAVINDIRSHQDELFDFSPVEIESETLPTVRGIDFQFKQLFENLIGNSVKYRHPERSPRIRITSTKVDAATFTHNDLPRYGIYHVITVNDNGLGFDQKYANKVFELFQRLDVKTISSGSGIGLTICRRIVQNHKGFITATGRPDEGATFNIYLPKQ